MKFNFRNKLTVFYAFNIILLLILVLLSFPLYKFFSYIAGNEKTIELSDNEFVKNASIADSELKSSKVINRIIKVNFKAEVENSLNWQFVTMENSLDIKVGENTVVKYMGKNLSEKAITATADFIVLPEKILPYFVKTECFCFKEQTLKPGESQIFSMVFFLDSSLDQDSNLSGINDLIVTYRFSELKG